MNAKTECWIKAQIKKPIEEVEVINPLCISSAKKRLKVNPRYKIEHRELTEKSKVKFILATHINTDIKIVLRYIEKEMISKIPQDIGIWKIKYKPKN